MHDQTGSESEACLGLLGGFDLQIILASDHVLDYRTPSLQRYVHTAQCTFNAAMAGYINITKSDSE